MSTRLTLGRLLRSNMPDSKRKEDVIEQLQIVLEYLTGENARLMEEVENLKKHIKFLTEPVNEELLSVD